MLRKETLKIVVIGDGGVGKTSLRHQFIHKMFVSSYKATIGADFITKEITHPDGQSVTLQIWDTAGQERFAALGAAYYRGADACLLVYDVSNYLTFEHLEKWRREFLDKAAPPDPDTFPFIVVGNKIDLMERVVSRRQACDFAAQCTSDIDRFPVPCIEASAKEGTNVDQVFNEIVRIVRMPQLELDMTNGTGTDHTMRASWPMAIMSDTDDDAVYADAWTFRLAHGDVVAGTNRTRQSRSSARRRGGGGGCC